MDQDRNEPSFVLTMIIFTGYMDRPDEFSGCWEHELKVVKFRHSIHERFNNPGRRPIENDHTRQYNGSPLPPSLYSH